MNESMIVFENGQKKISPQLKKSNSGQVFFFQVLVPAFNSMATIRAALDSVVSQTFGNWICIVLDDCSEDGTYGILQEYVTRFPDKFRVGRLERRIPTGEVRNMLMAEGANFNASYTLWLDSDDTFGSPEIFQKIFNRLKQTSYPDLLQLSYEVTFEDNVTEFRPANSTSVPQLSEAGQWQACWTKCVKTKLMPKFDSDLFRFEDTSFYFETLEKVRTVNFFNEGDKFPVVRYKINRQAQAITPKTLAKIQGLSKILKLGCVKKALQKTVEYWKDLCRNGVSDGDCQEKTNISTAEIGWMRQQIVEEKTPVPQNAIVVEKKDEKKSVEKSGGQSEKQPEKVPSAVKAKNGRKFGEVTVAMATFPPRIKYAVEVLKMLWPQCDHLKVCLNEFEKEPPEIQNFRKHIASSQNKAHTFEAVLANGRNGIPDLGCNNKMRWLDDCNGYYLTVDDDIGYPADYVKRLVEGIDRYDGKAVCSFHGKIYKNTQWGIDASNCFAFGFIEHTLEDIRVHVCGMGVGGFIPKTIGIKWSVFNTAEKNTGDDELTSIFCHEHNIPRIVLHKRYQWLTRAKINGYSLFGDERSRLKRQKLLEEKFKVVPEISIVVPCHNSAGTIRRILDKLRTQNNCDWECICVDDSANNDTAALIARYCQIDKRIVFIKNSKNPGAGENRNIGLKASRGKYVWFVDSDDELSLDKISLRSVIGEIKKTDADINVFPAVVKMDGKIIKHPSFDISKSDMQFYDQKIVKRSSLTDGKKAEACFQAFKIVPWNKIISREFLLKHANVIYFQNTHFANDNYFNMQLFRNFDTIAFHFIPPIYLYNRTSEAKSISGMENRSNYVGDVAQLINGLANTVRSDLIQNWTCFNRLIQFEILLKQVGEYRQKKGQTYDAYMAELAKKIGKSLNNENLIPIVDGFDFLRKIRELFVKLEKENNKNGK